jgi:hypothetical protein
MFPSSLAPEYRWNISSTIGELNLRPDMRNRMADAGLQPVYYGYNSAGLANFLSFELLRVQEALYPTIDFGYIRGPQQTAILVTLLVVGGLVIMSFVLVGVWRKTRVIYSSSPVFCFIFLFGTLINLLDVALLLEPPNVGMCAACRLYVCPLCSLLSCLTIRPPALFFVACCLPLCVQPSARCASTS